MNSSADDGGAIVPLRIHHYHYKKSAFFIISWQLIVSDILTQVIQLVLAVPITATGSAVYGDGPLVRSLASLDTIAYYGTLFFSFLMTANRATVFFSPGLNNMVFKVPDIYGVVISAWMLAHVAPITLNLAGCYKNFGTHGRYSYYDCSSPSAKQVYEVWYCIKTYLPVIMLVMYVAILVYLRYVTTRLATRMNRTIDRKKEYRLLLQSFLICGSLEVRDLLFNFLPYLNAGGQWVYVLNYAQNLILIFNNTLTPIVMFSFNTEIRARCAELIGGMQSRPSTPNFVNSPQTFTNVVPAANTRF
ncbi:hypothetical protein AAVH_25292 [Aphelenchoides avenae]|nr:hypothetical protein AAVH_25292 [Aphelenchus avenae]